MTRDNLQKISPGKPEEKSASPELKNLEAKKPADDIAKLKKTQRNLEQSLHDINKELKSVKSQLNASEKELKNLQEKTNHEQKIIEEQSLELKMAKQELCSQNSLYQKSQQELLTRTELSTTSATLKSVHAAELKQAHRRHTGDIQKTEQKLAKLTTELEGNLTQAESILIQDQKCLEKIRYQCVDEIQQLEHSQKSLEEAKACILRLRSGLKRNRTVFSHQSGKYAKT